MRLIFSRKGFDSSAGGCPSPLISGRPWSLPIPTRMPSRVRFEDLNGNTSSIVTALTRGRLSGANSCHLDPDLDANSLSRLPGWRGSLGQVAAAQSHLANQRIAAGDVFLFWGLYRPAEASPGWHFSGPREHRIFGWLQVGEIWTVGGDPAPLLKAHPWLQDHPHAQPGWPESNTVYIASEDLTIDGSSTGLRGWGVMSTGVRLTLPGSSVPSLWAVPDWLHPASGGVGLSYHPDTRWLPDGHLRAAARGQEFVADIGNRADARNWLVSLIGAQQ